MCACFPHSLTERRAFLAELRHGYWRSRDEFRESLDESVVA